MYCLTYKEPLIDRAALRAHTRARAEATPLIARCAKGDRAAVAALLCGFWPFVQQFEAAIDEEASRISHKPLVARFGREHTRSMIGAMRHVLKEMRDEEGSHALLWEQDAARLGITLGKQPEVAQIQKLIGALRDRPPFEIFCFLAGTEYVAEELAAYLCGSAAFRALFPDQTWRWGLAHAEEHDGPSHLQIDEDLARAYHPETDPAAVAADLKRELLGAVELFARAAESLPA